MVRGLKCTQLYWFFLCAALTCQATAKAADHASEPCVPILEKLLPGEYHYCAAVHDWQKGDNRAGVFEAKYAASWGEKRAQFALGVDYFNGRRGLAVDKVQGLAWLTLAAERKDPYYVSILTSARAQSTPEEQQRANTLVAKMQPDYGDAHVADYAERRFRTQWWAIRDHVWDALRVSHLDPWSNLTGVEIEGLGVVQPMMALRKLQDAGATYFHGWGQVSVGPLVPVSGLPAPASSTLAPSSQARR